jgi:DNA processing protein
VVDPLTETVALLRWSAASGVGRRRLRRAAEALGSVAGLERLPRARREALLGVAGAEPGPESGARGILTHCEALGVRALGWHEPDYPSRLLHLVDPPPVLYLVGDAGRLTDRQVAVVGSRSATPYGRRVARDLGRDLARAGLTVTSGMALGIDAEAHRGAIEAGGVSVAVLGSGPERAQPRRHVRLYRALRERGAVASEHPPGTPALGHHFPARNRLLAALAEAVVVVEAAERSGALITAREAAELGREVMAVPGPIDAATSRGTNALIRDGGTPVLGARSVLDALGIEDDPAKPTAAGGPADPASAALWQALSSRPRGIDELARGAGLAPREALAHLARLELDGWVRQEPGMAFRRERS